MEALGTYQGLSRPAANSTSEMQKVEGIPESPLQAVTQAALPTCTTETKTDCILLVPNFSAQSKQPPNLRMPCFPAEREKKKRGCVSPEQGLLGESTGRVERGGGSGHLEPPQTLPATVGSQNSGSFWPQALFSFLLPGPVQLRPLGRVGQP